jgi:hypothetical protein
LQLPGRLVELMRLTKKPDVGPHRSDALQTDLRRD